MGLLSAIHDFLLGLPERRVEKVRQQLRETELHPVYTWPQANTERLAAGSQSLRPSAPPLSPEDADEILGEVRRLKEEKARRAAQSTILYQRDSSSSKSNIHFQLGGTPGGYEDYLYRRYHPEEDDDDGLTVCDIHRKCNPRAFTNRIRQGVRDVYGGDAVPFYRNAGLSRSAYSRLLSHPDRHPSKDTALAMAASLRLDLPAAEEFIRLAGYALSPSYPEDVVWRMCFERGIHDLPAIRSLLDKV
jgi:hypothetical protein